MTQTEALTLEFYKEHAEGLQRDYDLLLAEYNAIKEALAGAEGERQQSNEQVEPVAWMQDTTCGLYVIDHPDEWHCIPLYTTPPQRTWVGLDHHDKKTFSSWLDHKSDDEVFSAIEAKLKELNT